MTSAPVTINLFQGTNGETAIRSYSKSGSYKKGYSVGFRAGSAGVSASQFLGHKFRRPR